MAKVLLVDDELSGVQMLSELLRGWNYEVIPCTNLKDALEALETQSPDVVVTDLYLDKTRAHGLEIVQKARSINPPVTVIVVTAHASIETAVDAMKKGAYDYLEKPFEVEKLKLCVERALSYNDAISENVYLRKQLKKKYQFNQLIGSSPKMQDVFKMIERVADTDSTVLLLGESGTGKELVARALHFNSRRQFAPFVPINCSALPENLLESELFGHRKGSFTGAINDKKGLFQEADGGTIFLDEIGSMTPVLQSRLLRVVQEREVRRVGDNTPIYVDVRVVAATNEPLERRVKEGTFREDLYYRLNVIAINLPPLRDRREDLPLLIAHFLKNKINPWTGKPFKISRQALEVLETFAWPGNVRELENVIERACVLCEGEVMRVTDLPPSLHSLATGKTSDTVFLARDGVLTKSQGNLDEGPGAAGTAETPKPTSATLNISNLASRPGPAPALLQSAGALKDFLREQERAHINRALAQTGGDKEKAAQLLGVSLATLYRKLSDEEVP